MHPQLLSSRAPRAAARRIAMAVSVWALALGAQAAPESQFEPAFAAFMRANGGEERAVEAFSALLQAEPTNPVP